MSASIVVVGSLNMDIVVRAPRHPELGEDAFKALAWTFSFGMR